MPAQAYPPPLSNIHSRSSILRVIRMDALLVVAMVLTASVICLYRSVHLLGVFFQWAVANAASLVLRHVGRLGRLQPSTASIQE
jgi:hypothetical protein